MTKKEQDTRFIKETAYALGFQMVGVSKAEFMEDEARKLEQWLNLNYHGEMGYMANHFDKRVNPSLLVPGAKSVISLIYNYFPEEKQHPDAPKLAKYAYGKDYHYVIKYKLKELMKMIQGELGEVSGRVFVDSAPLLERDLAKRAGLGWIGKNTMLINPKKGSFFFLAEVVVDLDLEVDAPMKDFCGTCTRCIDACPTEAIAPEGYYMDGSKCISYLTIELKENIPPSFKGKMENWMFGCDICQDVCPWNRFSSPHTEPEFKPADGLLDMKHADWEELTEEVFQKVFKKSAVKRTKFSGIKRNLEFLKKKD
ncbi:MAG: tRNA epoxyqueuosine(34) reductase QueG [Saprospiraceae bacterium]|nr:tRNA epoxyqueuosine(34) reductase QueG [Saprospiraceae bacterium]